MTPPNADDGTISATLIVTPAPRRRRTPAWNRRPSWCPKRNPDRGRRGPAEPDQPDQPETGLADLPPITEPEPEPAITFVEPPARPDADLPLAALRPAAPIGSVDRFDFTEISGWAWDSETPDQPIEIEIVDGDAIMLRIAADRYRPDLQKTASATGGTGS